jgi:hypothetical protein
MKRCCKTTFIFSKLLYIDIIEYKNKVFYIFSPFVFLKETVIYTSCFFVTTIDNAKYRVSQRTVYTLFSCYCVPNTIYIKKYVLSFKLSTQNLLKSKKELKLWSTGFEKSKFESNSIFTKGVFRSN